MGATQNSCEPGACSVTRIFCQPSSTRSSGEGKMPEKRRFCGPDAVSKKRSESVGARKLITDSTPIASGRDNDAESVIEMSQLTSQPYGVRPTSNRLVIH